MELETCCIGLDSNKITERRKSADTLRGIITTPQIISLLNSNDKCKSWNFVYDFVHRFIRKEGDKLYQDECKQKGSASFSRVQDNCHSLISAVVNQANSGEARLSVGKLVDSVIQCFDSPTQKKYFGYIYLTILVKNVLPVRKYWGEIGKSKWQDVFGMLQELYEDPNLDRQSVLKGLHLTIKFGTLHSSLSLTLRQHFKFVKSLCLNLKLNKYSTQQETILRLLLSFSIQLAKESRMASCRLGEDILHSIIDLYEPRYENHGGKKSLIFDFLLLQVRLHHPRGATEGTDSAFACNWNNWKGLLRSVYSILSHEVEIIVRKCPVKTDTSVSALWPNFLALFVEVCKQVFFSGELDVTQASILLNLSETCSLPAPKKARLEVGICTIISSIQRTGSWPWLCILAELLNTYPETIQPDDFLTLLKVSASLQAECKDLVTRHYLYKLLSAEVLAQDRLPQEHLSLEKIDTLWNNVWETALRSVGLNQNEEATHKLLQVMLHCRKSPKPLALLSIYTSGVLNISVHSIQTLNVLCRTIALPERINSGSDAPVRKYLIQFVLALNSEKLANSTVFSEKVTAHVLTGLLAKSWPYEDNFSETGGPAREYSSIEDSYILSSFDAGLVVEKPREKLQEQHEPKNLLLLSDSFDALKSSLTTFLEQLCERRGNQSSDMIALIHGIVLVLRVLSQLLECNVLTENTLTQFVDVERVFRRLYDVVSDHISSGNEDIQVLKHLESVFSLKVREPVSALVRRVVSVDFLKMFFTLLNVDSVDGADDMDEETFALSLDTELSVGSTCLLRRKIEKLQLVAMRILSHFSCVPNANTMNQKQQQVLDSLSEPEFDALNNVEFETTIYFLKSVICCKPGTLAAPTVTFILTALQNLMQAWHKDHDTALTLLQILKYSLAHVACSGSDELKTNALVLLRPFYERRVSYGPCVSLVVSDLMGDMIKLDPCWPENREIISSLLEFLKSDYHEVRLTTVKNVLHIFAVHSETSSDLLIRQEDIFKDMCRKILESFAVSSHMSEDQAIDEAACRTADALHAYSALTVASPVWRKKSLFAMIQLVSEKQINTDLVQKVLSIVASHLNMKDVRQILELNVTYFVNQWRNRGHSLSSFPYTLFGCQTSLGFFTRHINLMVPVLLQETDSEILKEVSKELNQSANELIVNAFPNIISQFLPIYAFGKASDEHGISVDDLHTSNRIFRLLEEMFSDGGITDLVLDNLDKVHVHLLNRFHDAEHLKAQFNLSRVLPEPEAPFYSYEMLVFTFKHLQEKLPTNEPIMAYYIKHCPSKLERILLEVTLQLHESATIDEKLVGLHRYSVLVDCIIPEMQSQSPMKLFLIRSITYTLINVIQLYRNNDEVLSIAACRYFTAFCEKCLPFCKTVFAKLLVLIISTLVPIAKLTTKLGRECFMVAHLLIVKNSQHLYNSIGSLDPFPQDEKFREIQQVYEKIKYGNDSFTLEQEIVHFLNAGGGMEMNDRAEGLQHLKVQLSEKKTELAKLYADLHKLHGFCDDFGDSILHQLICMLVQLTASLNSKVSLEAARCLGELGPADLTTLVLKPEKSVIEPEMNPLQLVVGQVVVLLSQYLVHQDINVAKVTSDALYVILSTVEGWAVAAADKKNYGFGVLEKSYILPFIPSAKPSAKTLIHINEHTFRTELDNEDLWCPTDQCTHADWIITLVCGLLQIFPPACYLRALIPVCKAKVEFAEKLFPLLIYLCLKKKTCAAVINKQVRKFFSNHWCGSVSTQPSSSQSSTGSVVTFNRASVQCMLNAIHFIRLRQSTSEDKKPVDDLDLNYLHVAQGAQFCSAYFTSILYAELWCYHCIEDKHSSSQNFGSSLDLICESEQPQVSQAMEIILREGYKKIGDVDAMHGCGTSYILNPRTRVEYYKDLGRWDKVTLHYDSLTPALPNNSCELVSSLRNSSLYHLASQYKTVDISTQYQCAWRLGQWTLGDTHSPESKPTHNNYEKYHYFALKSLHEQDAVSMAQFVEQARMSVIQSLSHASLESSKTVYTSLTGLQLLQEIENVSVARGEMRLAELFEKWTLCNTLNKNEFEYVEPIRAQRITMLTDLWLTSKGSEVKSCLADLHLELAEEARLEGFYNVAQRALNNISSMEHLCPETEGKVLFQQAQLSWIDDKTSGRYLLRHLLDKSDSISQHLYAVALKLYGNWMVETRSENATSIIENYFEKSLQILDELSGVDDCVEVQCEAFNSLARFADAQYQQVTSYIDSSVFESKVVTIKKLRDMAAQIHGQKGKVMSNDERRAVHMYEKQSAIDETEANNAYEEKNRYLILAVREYLRILEYSDSYNLQVFRILSLCLANKTNKALLAVLQRDLPKIASYKYVPLLPQLVPHTGSQNDAFEIIIHDLLERCAVDHPHHTLPFILALADSYKDRLFDDTFDLDNKSDSSEQRVQTAKDLVLQLRKQPTLVSILENMDQLSTALISLAYLDGKTCVERKKQLVVPKDQPIHSIKNLDNVLLPTITVEVRKNCNYNDIIGIREFSSNFAFVGGVNAPKRFTCLGTDGILRTQLIKGKDDLRQDAVMQQVFRIMNTLLAKNKQTSKLQIRTYKVVPLSQRSGIIEWCENTVPLGAYLTNAHKRYHPADWTPLQCRNELKAIHSKGHDAKYRKYMQICSKFRPIFHMFFIASYPQPTVWFERRRAYMHSVATSSMVGYILGLGDRHVQNILLDKNTAEVVHIDFGIAFEQGRILPTPETVPFRLTRDIESGMGICGIEGVFRRSCEKTMLVLRQNAETVLTILEVLLYDPLYAWTITAAEAYSRQRDEEVQEDFQFSEEDPTSVNVTAERALMRLKQKLQGTENGCVCSVDGQVELLLQQARDPVNLSRLYNGWQPYL